MSKKITGNQVETQTKQLIAQYKLGHKNLNEAATELKFLTGLPDGIAHVLVRSIKRKNIVPFPGSKSIDQGA
jgi:hypothetical protein